MNESKKRELRATIEKKRELARELADLDSDLEQVDTTDAWNASCVVANVEKGLRRGADELAAVLDGATPIRRVAPIATGFPWKEDTGGGFGARAIDALAACREAWTVADAHNARWMESAMASIARAWLGTVGRERLAAIRAVLAHTIDASRKREEFVERVVALATRASVSN